MLRNQKVGKILGLVRILFAHLFRGYITIYLLMWCYFSSIVQLRLTLYWEIIWNLLRVRGKSPSPIISILFEV